MADHDANQFDGLTDTHHVGFVSLESTMSQRIIHSERTNNCTHERQLSIRIGAKSSLMMDTDRFSSIGVLKC